MGERIEVVPQYGCYTFALHKTLPSPVIAYKNKWANDWASHWFYHKVPPDPVTWHHPLVVNRFNELGETPKVSVIGRPDHEAFVGMLQKVAKTFGNRDIVKEYVAYDCFLVKVGWSISAWLAKDRWTDNIPVPDYSSLFGLQRDRMFADSPLFCPSSQTVHISLTHCSLQGSMLLLLRIGPTKPLDLCLAMSTKHCWAILEAPDETVCSMHSRLLLPACSGAKASWWKRTLHH